MSTRITDESLLLSKYLSNNSNKAAEAEKTTKSATTSSTKNSDKTAGSKYDSFETNSLSNPYIYNNYNSSGEYETMPSLVDYLDDESGSLFGSSSSSDSDAMELLGSSGGSNSSLVDFLSGGDNDDSENNYGKYFSSLSAQNTAKTNALIKEATEKMNAKKTSSPKVAE